MRLRVALEMAISETLTSTEFQYEKDMDHVYVLVKGKKTAVEILDFREHVTGRVIGCENLSMLCQWEVA